MSKAPHSRAAQAARAASFLLARFTLVFIGALAFVELLLWAAPGDAIDLVPNGLELREMLAAEWGLDQPLLARIGDRLVDASRGDLGESLIVRPGTPVMSMTATSSLRSAWILFPALMLSTGTAFMLAYSEQGRSRQVSNLVHAVSTVPVFLLAWCGVSALNGASFWLMERGLITRPDWFALPLSDSPLRTALAISALAIGSGVLSGSHTELSAEMRRLIQGPMVFGLRARGTPLANHLLSNLLAPVASLAASRLTFLLGGLVIIETVLLFNGAGALLWQAALKRDYPLAAGLTLAAAAVVSSGRLLSELAQLLVDPRLQERP